MRPQRLLQVSPVQPFIESIQEEGIGCSGVLQRLDAHAQALKFLNFSTERRAYLRESRDVKNFFTVSERPFIRKRLQGRGRVSKPTLHPTSPESSNSSPMETSGRNFFRPPNAFLWEMTSPRASTTSASLLRRGGCCTATPSDRQL